jgi:hypothetical protein
VRCGEFFVGWAVGIGLSFGCVAHLYICTPIQQNGELPLAWIEIGWYTYSAFHAQAASYSQFCGVNSEYAAASCNEIFNQFMRLITNQANVEKEFLRLTNKYQSFRWVDARAGINSKPVDELKTTGHQIKNAIVGIHFYQTHPNFIGTFSKNKNAHYILLREGSFHPKIYFFINSDSEWEPFVESAILQMGRSLPTTKHS